MPRTPRARSPREKLIPDASKETTLHISVPWDVKHSFVGERDEQTGAKDGIFTAAKAGGLRRSRGKKAITPQAAIGTWWDRILAWGIAQAKLPLDWREYEQIAYAETEQVNMRVQPDRHEWIRRHTTAKKSPTGVSANRFVVTVLRRFLALGPSEQAKILDLDAVPVLRPELIPVEVKARISPRAARGILRLLRGPAYEPEKSLGAEVAMALEDFDKK